MDPPSPSAGALAEPPAEQVTGYSDLHRIGHGGFSVVYRARHAGLHRVVALKVLTVEFVDAPVKRALLREVQLAGRLSGHPNVVTVLDSGMTSSGRPFIAMDYYERGSLRDRLSAEGPLPLGEVLRAGIKIAGALAAAHQEGILHRDVKPQNILVSRYGEPALADFGTARLTTELEATRTDAFTPFHAAPEVLEGHQPGPGADVYSLGSTMYQLLAGRPAFQRDADAGIAPLLLRILTEEPPPISRPDVPEPVWAVIRRAMHRDPAQRYASAQALVAALREQQQALGLQATEPAGGVAELTGPAPGHAQNGPTSEQAQSGRRPVPGSQAEGRPRPAPADPEPAQPPQETPPRQAQPAAPGLAPPGVALPPIIATSWDNPEKTGYRPRTPGPGHAAPTARQTLPDDLVTPPRRPPAPGVPAPGVPAGSPAPAPEPPPAEPRRRGGVLPLAIGAVAVVAALTVAVPLVLVGRHGGTGTQGGQPQPSASAGLATGTAPVPVSSVVPGPPQDAPTNLTVQLEGSGDIAELTWSLRPPSNSFPLLVYQVQPENGAAPVSLTPGTTSYAVTGLTPGIVYCFQVSAYVAAGSQHVQVSSSNQACTG